MNAGNDADTFIGGTGADTFEFAQDTGEPSTTAASARATATGSSTSRAARATRSASGSSRDDLTFVGEEAAPGVNEVGFIETGGSTILRANTADGADAVDFEIALDGVGLGLDTGDFVF